MSGDEQQRTLVRNQPGFLSAVMLMDNNLLDEDVESLKFLCQGLVMASKLKRIKAFHELVTCLENLQQISENNFFLLADLLQYIERVDVLEKIGFKEEEVISQRQQQGSRIEAFYVLLFDIAEDLKSEDVKKAVYRYGRVPGSKTVSCALDLFTLMIQHKAIDPTDVSQLVTIFQELERPDFVDMLKKYIESGGRSVTEKIEEDFRRKVLVVSGDSDGTMPSASSQSAQQGTERSSRNAPCVRCNDQLPGHDTRQQGVVPPDNSDDRREPARQGAHFSQEPSDGPVMYYKMDRNPRGVCLIINNKKFKPHTKFSDREGTDIDKANLEKTFKQLNFHVISRDNCTDKEMAQLLKEQAADNHSGYDCFVCCILTHGTHGALYGTNGMQVPIQDLTSPFGSVACPGLAGKPKLFFLQACQGKKSQRGHMMNDIEQDCCLETDRPLELIPNEADFLLGYATVPGFVCYRSTRQGSWYITKLTEVLSEYAYSLDILEILTRVNYEIGQQNADIDGYFYKQSPAPTYTLRKKLIFRPIS